MLEVVEMLAAVRWVCSSVEVGVLPYLVVEY
jgi:hypothetical protein